MLPVATIEDIEIEIRRAVFVERSLPKIGPKPLKAFWPDMPKEAQTGLLRLPRFRPLPEEIDDMDLVFEQWFRVLSFEDKQLLCRRIGGQPWKKLCFTFQKSRSQLVLRYKKALESVLAEALLLQNASDKKHD
jgi:hypothetical protein